MSRVEVVLFPDTIPLLHTIYPLLRSRYRRNFRFHTDPESFLHNTRRGSTVCLLRYSKFRRSGRNDGDYLRRIRERSRTLVYIDDDAATGRLDGVALQLCDRYYKKQLYRDRSLYLRPLVSSRVYLQNYADRGIYSAGPVVAPAINDESLLGKLRLLWNVGIGCYPRTPLRQRVAPRLQRAFGVPAVSMIYGRPLSLRGNEQKHPYIHARFSASFTVDGISYHRGRFLDEVSRDSRFVVGTVPIRQYNRELRSALGVLSPYGYGEVCFRDFEAAMNGAVLLKPDMSPIETWPDIYRSYETYLPLAWDGCDVIDVAERLLNGEFDSGTIASNARQTLNAAFGSIEERTAAFIDDILPHPR